MRRAAFATAALAAPAIDVTAEQPQAPGAPAASDANLPLKDYKPKSMLQVHESHVERARFPVIDIHTHLTESAKYDHGVAVASEREFLATPEELLQVMEAKNIRTLINLTGGYGKGLTDSIARYDKAHPGRFISICEPI